MTAVDAAAIAVSALAVGYLLGGLRRKPAAPAELEPIIDVDSVRQARRARLLVAAICERAAARAELPVMMRDLLEQADEYRADAAEMLAQLRRAGAGSDSLPNVAPLRAVDGGRETPEVLR